MDFTNTDFTNMPKPAFGPGESEFTDEQWRQIVLHSCLHGPGKGLQDLLDAIFRRICPEEPAKEQCRIGRHWLRVIEENWAKTLRKDNETPLRHIVLDLCDSGSRVLHLLKDSDGNDVKVGYTTFPRNLAGELAQKMDRMSQRQHHYIVEPEMWGRPPVMIRVGSPAV